MLSTLRAATAALALAVAAAAPAWAAGEFGTPEEARAMLDKAVAAIKSDKAGTIATINAGQPGAFRDRDLYVFCGDAAGTFTAHGANQKLIGTSLKDLKDKAGTPLGEQIYATAADGQVAEVAYMWPRPGQTEPTQKVAFVTKAADEVCAVGYYK